MKRPEGFGVQPVALALTPDGARRFADAGVQVLNGRYGPYITDKARNARIPKDRDPKSLTLEECQRYLHMESCPAQPGP